MMDEERNMYKVMKHRDGYYVILKNGKYVTEECGTEMCRELIRTWPSIEAVKDYINLQQQPEWIEVDISK